MHPNFNDEWFRPAYHHRQPGILPGTGRSELHRSLRLTMAAGTVAAGLCLVVGLVTLVVAAGGTSVARMSANSHVTPAGPGGSAAPVGSATPAGPATPGAGATPGAPATPGAGATPGAPATPGASATHAAPATSAANVGTQSPTPSPGAPGQVLATILGSGVQPSVGIHTPPPGDWILSWSYFACPGGQATTFTVGETKTPAKHALLVSSYQSSDYGTTLVYDHPGHHSLVVVSQCSWELQVIAPPG